MSELTRNFWDKPDRTKKRNADPCPSKQDNGCCRCSNGGFIPVVYVSKRGVAEGKRARITQGVVTCTCDIGMWMWNQRKHAGERIQSYDDVPESILPRDHVRMADIVAFNRVRESALRKQFGMVWLDYDTNKWYDGDGNEMPKRTPMVLDGRPGRGGDVARAAMNRARTAINKARALTKDNETNKGGDDSATKPASAPQTDVIPSRRDPSPPIESYDNEGIV